MNELDFRLKSLPTSCLDIVPAATEDVTVERTLFAADIEQGNNTDVTFSIEGVRAGGIVKMIPGGFTVAGVDRPADRYGNSGKKVLFSAIGDTVVRIDDTDRPDYFQTGPRGENYYRFADAPFNGLIDDLDGSPGVTRRKTTGDERQVILFKQVPRVPIRSMGPFDAHHSDRFAGIDSLIIEDGGDINILSHARQAGTEVNR